MSHPSNNEEAAESIVAGNPIPDKRDVRIKELESQNALFRVVLTSLFQEVTQSGQLSQTTFDLLSRVQSDASDTANVVYERLKSYKLVADAAAGVYDYMIGDAVRRKWAIRTLRVALGRPLVAPDEIHEHS